MLNCELERIAYLSYHRMNGNLSMDEMNELINLLIEWKKQSDEKMVKESYKNISH